MREGGIYQVLDRVYPDNPAKLNVFGMAVAVGALMTAPFGIPASAAVSVPIPTAYYGHSITRGKEEGTLLQFESNPEFYGGRPMLPGTGLPAWIVAQMLQSGETIADCLEAYPFLTEAILERYVPVLTTTPPEQLGAPIDPWSL